MRVLLTGGSGYIGRALAHRLGQCQGWQLRLVTRRSEAQTSADVVRVEDLSVMTDWAPLVQQVDSVVHTAARVHVMRETATSPLEAFRQINVTATLKLAQAAAQSGAKRFVFISSVKVLGEATPTGAPWTENSLATPEDPYGQSKHEAELGLRQIATDTGMEVVIIRPPLVYGPGVKANFAALMAAIAKGTPLPLGALHNRRSLVALDNLVDFIMTCLTHPSAANQTFLVSDGEDLSTTELAHRLGIALQRPARLIPVPAAWLMAGARLLGRRAAAERVCGNLQVDISKARSLLGWTPPINVDEGLLRATTELRP